MGGGRHVIVEIMVMMVGHYDDSGGSRHHCGHLGIVVVVVVEEMFYSTFRADVLGIFLTLEFLNLACLLRINDTEKIPSQKFHKEINVFLSIQTSIEKTISLGLKHPFFD